MIENKQLTKNFTLFEFINSKMPSKAIIMNYATLDKMQESERNIIFENITAVALTLQKIRDKYNLPIVITSGYRCEEWEKYRERSGNSQHTRGLAVDFYVMSENRNLIMNDIMKDYKNFMGGLATKKNGDDFVFIHIDLRTPSAEHIHRGYGARWTY